MTNLNLIQAMENNREKEEGLTEVEKGKGVRKQEQRRRRERRRKDLTRLGTFCLTRPEGKKRKKTKIGDKKKKKKKKKGPTVAISLFVHVPEKAILSKNSRTNS